MKLKFIYLFLISVFLFSCGGTPDEYADYDTSYNDNVTKVNTAHDKKATSATKATNPTDDSEEASSTTFYVLLFFLILLGLFVPFFFWYFVPIGLWYQAYLSGLRPGWWRLAKMRLQSIPQDLILNTMIKAKNAGLKLKTSDISAQYLAGVDVVKVTNTAIRAVNAGFSVSFTELASQFLAKVDVETVMHAVITGKNADLDITLKQVAAQYLANVDVILVVEALITAHNAGYDTFSLDDLKEHYLANGNVMKTVEAFIAAKEADFSDVEFKHIAAIDLAGINVTEAVASAVNPKVVETDNVVGIAKDGVQLFMKLKLTLRANLKRMIGGATEATVLARIDESLATEIGRAESHYDVIQSPFLLADVVEQKNLGEGTAFDVISVDVAEITIGKDVHAELQIERAHAESETAKANLIKAEEKVQKAMAAAFLDGKLSVHEYNEIQNTEADTHMRKRLGDSTKPKNKEVEDNKNNKKDDKKQ